jgi:tripartite-type tricarboxylate transporter receptor subunit TctC
MRIKKTFLRCAFGLLLSAAVAHAQDAATSSGQVYPAKPVRLIGATAAGGSGDVHARRFAQRLAKVWNQSVVVENIAGGAGNGAAAATANAVPDGYTLFFAPHPVFAVNPLLYEKLPFNLERDLLPVILISKMPHVLLVNAQSPFATLPDLIASAKAQPKSLNFGSGGTGSSIHLAGELLNSAAGIELTHIPYKGGAPSLAALIGGEIQLLFDASMTAIGDIAGGRVRGLAIASQKRSTALPNIPTFDESGVRGFESVIAHVIIVSAKTPPAIVATLTRSINAVLNEPDYRKQMSDAGVELIGGGEKEARAYLEAERRKWAAVIQKRGIKPN